MNRHSNCKRSIKENATGILTTGGHALETLPCQLMTCYHYRFAKGEQFAQYMEHQSNFPSRQGNEVLEKALWWRHTDADSISEGRGVPVRHALSKWWQPTLGNSDKRA